jgi:hypothetical protein
MSQSSSPAGRSRSYIAGALTAVTAIGGLAGWLLATVFEYLQWAAAARWTLHVTVALVAVAVVAALATYVWRDEDPDEDSDRTGGSDS